MGAGSFHQRQGKRVRNERVSPGGFYRPACSHSKGGQRQPMVLKFCHEWFLPPSYFISGSILPN